MKIIAHRGASGEAPENTLKAMALAIEQGADGIELDVHLCAGELVVIHDDSVDKRTNGSGQVSHFSLEQLQALDAGDGEAVPTLWQVLQLIGDRIDLNIELKGAGSGGPLPALLAEAQQQLGLRAEQIIVSSFDHRMLSHFAEQAPQYAIGALTERRSHSLAKFASKLNADAVHIHLRGVNAALVEDAHQRGLKVYVYTVNRSADLDRMNALGVDGVFTDFPGRSRAYLQQSQSTQGWR
ncbi:glycerophosphodiester phosphodiesterase [Ferrimonas senticii]|uniref:glycerophosphodiester phosphodiesterase n=1 Tax=Ferrimonas senticii TaxID=394566 RepID=UPI0004007DA3|nr:glycerophosphodiester phosphodiesterase family protein [Ferrimonas senticii]